MAYTIGQIRRDSSNSGSDSSEGKYMVDLTSNIILTKVRSQSPFDPDSTSSDFYDYALKLTQGTFLKNKSYYVRLSILRVPLGYYSKRIRGRNNIYAGSDTLEFSLGLRKTDIDDATNRINDLLLNQSFSVDPVFRETKALENSIFNYTTVFTPKIDGCTVLVLKLKRYSFDALERASLANGETLFSAAKSYRRWLLQNNGVYVDGPSYIYYIDNTNYERYTDTRRLPRISYSGLHGDVCSLNPITLPSKSLSKIGFQARPGSLIVVNKSPIRLGKSGVYEINNGTKVHEICVTAPQGYDNSKIDAFLLDYAYES